MHSVIHLGKNTWFNLAEWFHSQIQPLSMGLGNKIRKKTEARNTKIWNVWTRSLGFFYKTFENLEGEGDKMTNNQRKTRNLVQGPWQGE